MLNTTDIEYNLVGVRVKGLLDQIFLKTCFLMMSDKGITLCNERFHELIDSISYYDIHAQDKIGEDLVLQAFKKAKRERCQPRIILGNNICIDSK